MKKLFELSRRASDEILGTRRNGGRIIAVGTTVVRVLEHCSLENGTAYARRGVDPAAYSCRVIRSKQLMG